MKIKITLWTAVLCLFFQINLSAQKQELTFTKFQVETLQSKILNHRNQTVTVPFFDNGELDLILTPNQIFDESIENRFPNHKSYRVHSPSRKGISGFMSSTPTGIFYTLHTANGFISLKPGKIKDQYILERGLSNERRDHICHLEEGVKEEIQNATKSQTVFTNGDFLRIYRMALIVTGEFYQANGNDDDTVLSWVQFSIDGLNTIFQQNLAVSFRVDNRLIFFNDPETDIFIPDNDGGDGRTTQAGEALEDNFELEDFDIGHVLHNTSSGDNWSGGGIARLNALCNDTNAKAQGWSGSFNNQGNGWIGLFAHEIGHMCGASHTFNGTGGSCTNAISENNAYEIASGVTIMSYLGICGDQNIPGFSSEDDYFHSNSIEAMLNRINNVADCHTTFETNNLIPEMEINPCEVENYKIPINTPFRLEGAATELNADQTLTYSWEQYDEDGEGTPTQGLIGEAAANEVNTPLFRNYAPSENPQRTFPTLENILSGEINNYEVLPLVEREIAMRLVVRDNFEGGGAIAVDELSIDVENGPLEFITPSASSDFVFDAGQTMNIVWDTNGSDNLCDKVNITLSTNGGTTFDIPIAEDIDYSTGSFDFDIPAGLLSNTESRIKIECMDYSCFSFFIISDQLTINSECEGNTTSLCDTDALIATEGDPSLDLNIETIFGSEVSDIEFDITSDSPFADFVRRSVDGECQIPFFPSGNPVRTPIETYNFVVDEDDSYTFLRSGNGFFTVYETSLMDSQDACAGWIESSARAIAADPDGVTTGNSTLLTIELSKCVDYTIVATTFSGTSMLSVSTIGSPIIQQDEELADGTEYTFVLVETDTDEIVEVLSDSDLTETDAGNYLLYGVQYQEGTDTQSWVGLTFTDILLRGDCFVTSTNNKPINIEINENDPCNESDLSISASSTFTNCAEDTGSATIEISGGSQPYTILWSNNMNTNTISNLSASIYTVSVTDGEGCEEVANVTVNELPDPEIEFTLEDMTLTAEVVGGMNEYTYTWLLDNQLLSDEGNSIELSEDGTYTVLIVDIVTGCDFEDSFDYVDFCAEFLVEEQIQQISCNGDEDGAISLTPLNGQAPYSYFWTTPTGPSAAQSLSGLVPGSYLYVVTDANSCTFNGIIQIEEPSAITINLITIDESSQGLNNGSITAEIDGGTQPYTIEWTGPNGFSADLDEIQELAPGEYTIFVTDQNDCITSDNVTIMTGNCPPGEVEIELTNPTCFGFNDGAASLSGFNSERTYTILWSTDETTESIENLEAGTYEVLITDDLSCSQAIAFSLSEPDELTVDIESTNETSLGLSDGTALATPSGGTGAFLIEWVDENGLFIDDVDQILNLDPGLYCVIITDQNNCSVEECVEILPGDDPCLGIVSDRISSNVSCFGGSDGMASIEIPEATEPFDISWSNGETSLAIENLEAGEYGVTLVDANECEFQEVFVITQPEDLSVDLTIIDESTLDASDGMINTTVSGGTSPYTYLWTNGETTANISDLSPGEYCLEITDTNGCTLEVCTDINPGNDPCEAFEFFFDIEPISCFGETGIISAVTNGGSGIADITIDRIDGELSDDHDGTTFPAGVYEYTAIDENQCTIIDTITLTEPEEIQLDITTINETSLNAEDGSASVLVSGGTEPYAFIWSDAMGDIIGSEELVASLSPGEYCIEITDGNNCITEDCIEILAGDDLCAEFSIELEGTNANCFGNSDGAINTIVEGGLEPYIYAWSDGSTLDNIQNIAAGTYTVTITDANECEQIASIDIDEADQLALTLITTDETTAMANDGMISADVEGGIMPYSYTWSDGSMDDELNNLAPGNYCVTVTDTNGCSIEACADVLPGEFMCPDIDLSISALDIACFGESTGSITVNAISGANPYTYLWSNSATTQSIDNLDAGEYSVTVTDSNNCTSKASIEVSQADEILINPISQNESIMGAEDGSIFIEAVGGTGSFSFAWNNGAITANIENLSAGTYCLTVTDENNCTAESCITIEAGENPCNNTTIIIESITTDATCNTFDNGSSTVEVSGGTAPYTYLWSNGQTSATATNLSSGQYTINVMDSNGCEAEASTTVSEPNPLTASATQQINESTTGANDGSISVTVNGGTAPFTYSWSNGATTNIIDNLAGGNYELLIEDSNGCTLSVDYTIGTNTTSTGTARVQFIHAAFDETISIESDQGSILSYLACTMATPPMEVPAGINQTYTLTPLNFWAAYGDEVDLSVSFEEGGSYIAVLHGTFDPNDNFPLEFSVIPFGFEQQAPEEVSFNFFNGSYEAPILSLDNANDLFLENINYGEFSPMQSVASVSETHQLTLSDGNGDVVNTYSEDFSYWKTNSIMFFTISEFANLDETQVWVALSDGGSYQLQGQLRPSQELRRAFEPKNLAADIFPNPSTFLPTIRLTLDKLDEIEVEIFHISGKLIQRKSFGYLNRGEHHLFMSNNRLHAGNYIVRIRGEEDVVVKSLQIID